MSTPNLFLEPSDHGTYQVVQREPGQRSLIISDEKMPDKAIQCARRQGYLDDIIFGSGVSTIETDEVYSTLEIIQELANLGGFKVRQAYDDHMRIIGWTMELKE